MRDLYALNPALADWVPHVLVFIVPRQIVPLGDPSKRSCDACESLGAKIKKIIRNNTCHRRPTGTTKHAHRSADGKRLWLSTFTRGYVEQAFRRVCVSADLLHGPGNQRYLQARDYRLLTKGKDAREKADKEGTSMSVLQALDAPTVWCQEAALAVWS